MSRCYIYSCPTSCNQHQKFRRVFPFPVSNFSTSSDKGKQAVVGLPIWGLSSSPGQRPTQPLLSISTDLEYVCRRSDFSYARVATYARFRKKKCPHFSIKKPKDSLGQFHGPNIGLPDMLLGLEIFMRTPASGGTRAESSAISPAVVRCNRQAVWQSGSIGERAGGEPVSFRRT